MQFSASGSALLEGFQVAASVVGPRATREVTRSIKLQVTKDEVRIFATGDETAVNFHLRHESIQAPGEVVLPAETMVGVLRESRNEAVSLQLEDHSCSVQFDRSQFRCVH